MSFFKKKASTKANAANVHMTEAEAALAQSDFNIDKILEIQNKFTGGTALLLPGRIFIREGMLWKVCRKGPKKRQFFLFNDILVYGSVVAGRYSNQHVLPLAHMAVSGDPSYQPEINTTFTIDSLDEQLDIHNAFQISHADKSFHVFSLSQADKANWLANLQKHINKVALVGGSQSVTPRAVWVPDSHSKDCMICGQKFTAFNRKHHCRQCGRVVCSTCSPHRVIIDSQSDAKPERVCSECVKDVSPIKTKASPELTNKPPPAAVAAQLVSSVLRHNSEHHSPSHTQSAQSPRQHRRNSTDTEDSDDSEEEERGVGTPPTKKKPTPVPRRTQSAKHVSPTGSPVVPPQRPPQRPPPFNSVRRPPVSSQTPTTEVPKPKPRVKKPEVEVETAAKREGEEGSEAGREREKGKGAEGEGEGEGAGGEGGKGEGAEVASEEVQPTPPPRKRKKAKLKQKLEQQLQQHLEPNDNQLVEEVQQDEASLLSAAVEGKGDEEGVSIAGEEEGTMKEMLEEEGQQGSEGEGAKEVGEEESEGEGAKEVGEEESEGEGAKEVGEEESEGEGAKEVGEEESEGGGAKEVGEEGSEGGGAKEVGEEGSEGEGAKEVGEEGSEGEGAKEVGEEGQQESEAQEVGETDGLEGVEATEIVEDDGLLVTEQEVMEGEGEGVPLADGEVEETGDKIAPRRPRRRRKHFNEGQEECGTNVEDTPTQTDSTHQLEDTPTQTDSAHRDDSTADHDPSSQIPTSYGTYQSNKAEREGVPSEELPVDEKLPGPPPDLSGQLSGQPTEGVPVKKPRGRKPKFKTAETQ